jgi:hypothetical protein
MKISKKFMIIGLMCVVVIGGTLGGFAIAGAADDAANTTRVETGLTTLIDKAAEIYQQNTGTAIDAAELQKAFEAAGAALMSDRMEQYLQKLVDDGKITQEQADAWKAWWASRPAVALTDEFQTWMESRPDVPGMFGAGRMMPFGRGGCLGSANSDSIRIGPMMRGFRSNIVN